MLEKPIKEPANNQINLTAGGRRFSSVVNWRRQDQTRCNQTEKQEGPFLARRAASMQDGEASRSSIPARPFLVISDEDMGYIRQYAGKVFRGVRELWHCKFWGS